MTFRVDPRRPIVEHPTAAEVLSGREWLAAVFLSGMLGRYVGAPNPDRIELAFEWADAFIEYRDEKHGL